MSDDLVRRLRDFDPHNMHEWEAVDLAADRIEELERERVLDAKLLADTQALLDKAGVALRFYSCDNSCDDCPVSERGRISCGWTARTVLAEIEGGKKDE